MTPVRASGRRAVKEAAHAAYVDLVARARSPAFYAEHGVPDTVDGRFEMIALHAFLVLYRLRGEAAGREFGQALHDVLFADMDRSLREMGTGDLSVGREVKRMAQSFYGRIAAYQSALAGESDLDSALRRNLFGTVAPGGAADVAFMAAYLRRQAAALAALPVAEVAAGRIVFAPIEG
jgi:cytochrome b pre-mRNA-processing protein 3